MEPKQILTPQGRETDWGFDVYSMNLTDTKGDLVDLEIMNVISWESTKIRMTRDELRGFSNFINSHLDD
ncbi:hypothetical protein EB169_08240 [archaeon]|nr:hypothetical protein [archaeon]